MCLSSFPRIKEEEWIIFKFRLLLDFLIQWILAQFTSFFWLRDSKTWFLRAWVLGLGSGGGRTFFPTASSVSTPYLFLMKTGYLFSFRQRAVHTQLSPPSASLSPDPSIFFVYRNFNCLVAVKSCVQVRALSFTSCVIFASHLISLCTVSHL